MRKWILVALVSASLASIFAISVLMFWPNVASSWSQPVSADTSTTSPTNYSEGEATNIATNSGRSTENSADTAATSPAEETADEATFVSTNADNSTENYDDGTADPIESSRSASEPWLVTLIGKIAWPIALLLSLAFISWDSRLRRLFGAGSRLVRTIRAGGLEMEISSEAVDDVRKQLRGSFRELVGSARDEYERMADLQDIERRLATVIEQEVVPNFTDPRPENLRATIHVRDIIFRDYLYQLVNYYPRGGGAHRRFSQRYGIIGRSWRSRTSHGTGNAFGDNASDESLVEEWGMTTDEAHGMLNSKPSCLSVVLRSDGIETGILYIDSSTRAAFGEDADAQKFVENLEGAPRVKELGAAVERALAPLRAAAPNFDLKELG